MERRSSSSGGGKRSKGTPAFLHKVYSILESVSGDIACWSESGDSFVVKVPSRFAKEVLPQYFKTDNFSSFVRQLNFYGFRKVSADESSSRHNLDRRAWEFRHPKFLRERPDLLEQIKRRTYTESHPSAGKLEVEELKHEVDSLKQTMSEMRETMNHMSMILMRALQPGAASFAPGVDPSADPMAGVGYGAAAAGAGVESAEAAQMQQQAQLQAQLQAQAQAHAQAQARAQLQAQALAQVQSQFRGQAEAEAGAGVQLQSAGAPPRKRRRPADGLVPVEFRDTDVVGNPMQLPAGASSSMATYTTATEAAAAAAAVAATAAATAIVDDSMGAVGGSGGALTRQQQLAAAQQLEVEPATLQPPPLSLSDEDDLGALLDGFLSDDRLGAMLYASGPPIPGMGGPGSMVSTPLGLSIGETPIVEGVLATGAGSGSGAGSSAFAAGADGAASFESRR